MAEASVSGADASRSVVKASPQQQEHGIRRVIYLHNTPVPAEWLVVSKERYPNALASPRSLRKVERDARWAASREQLLAAGAAAVHVAMFAYNLMFWGFEGMPQDRYWPSNPRVKLQIQPGRFGNLEGAKRFYYDNLARFEGAD